LLLLLIILILLGLFQIGMCLFYRILFLNFLSVFLLFHGLFDWGVVDFVLLLVLLEFALSLENVVPPRDLDSG
jgi:hypothetical protein